MHTYFEVDKQHVVFGLAGTTFNAMLEVNIPFRNLNRQLTIVNLLPTNSRHLHNR